MTKRRSTDHRPPSTALAVALGWVLPGLGHWWIGERARAAVLFVIVTVTFWGGVAVGGVRTVVSERENGPWIAAQLCMGPQALVALKVSRDLRAIEANDAKQNFKAPWPSGDIGVIYAGVAGLLNLLVMLDVISRLEAGRAAQAPGEAGMRREEPT